MLKASTRNTSVFKRLFLLFSFLILANPVFAAGPKGEESNPFKVLSSKIEEKVGPLFQAASPGSKETTAGKKSGKKKKEKTHAEKLQENRQDFYQKEQDRKSKFLQKIRGKNLTGEERQRKIAKFYAKELERKQKFAEKMKRERLKNTQ